MHLNFITLKLDIISFRSEHSFIFNDIIATTIGLASAASSTDFISPNTEVANLYLLKDHCP